MPARRILVLHGPNLNLLPGTRSVDAIDAALNARAVALGVELKTVQSNWEGALLDTLASERNWFEALIVNPATLAPTAVALAEAIKLLDKPAIEVQLDDVKKTKSALKDVVDQQIAGKGPNGYLEALVALAPKSSKPSFVAAASIPLPPAKTLGARTVESAVLEARGPKGKSIGREAPSEKNVGRVLPTGEIVKSIGGRQRPQLAKKPPVNSGKSLGGRKNSAASPGTLSRAAVRQQIADRLAGTVSPAGLAAWARAEWQKLQSGAPMESGQRDMLEDVLQQLLLSATMKASDDQLIELMTQLSE
jgi:3-dehydroquinate dehydratase II